MRCPAARDAHRLETLGRLCPSFAHDLSTPAQFMGDSVSFLASALESYSRLLHAYGDLAREAGSLLPDTVERLRAVEREVDLPFLHARAPRALSRIDAGVQRIAATARAFSALSRTDNAPCTGSNLGACIEHALALLSPTARHVARVEVRVDPTLAVRAAPGETLDVVLNVLLNAVESVAAAGHREATGTVHVSAEARPGYVCLDVIDNGAGVSPAHRARLFDHGFTTKPGRRGHGLAITREVLALHGGLAELVECDRGAHFRLSFAGTQGAVAP
jgi:two-component system NtrC family sensor kinase